jgi:hypothetical protein
MCQCHYALCVNVLTSLRLMCQRHNVTVAHFSLCFVKLAYSVLSVYPSLSFHFPFLTRVNSSRFNLIQCLSSSIFSISSHFNALILHFIVQHVKTSYSVDYGFIQWFVLIPFPFALLSFACCLVKFSVASSTYFLFCGFPLTRFALSVLILAFLIIQWKYNYVNYVLTQSICNINNMYILYMYYVSEKMNQKRK